MKYRKGLIYRTWAKALCFIIFIISVTLFVLSGLATAFMLSENVYITDREIFKKEAFSSHVWYDALFVAEAAETGDFYNIELYLKESNITYALVEEESGAVVAEFGDKENHKSDNVFSKQYFFESSESKTEKTYTVTIALAENFKVKDYYYTADKVVDIMYNVRILLPALCLVLMGLAAFSFVNLMCVSGRRSEDGNVVAGWGTNIPFDLVTAVTGICSLVVLCAVWKFSYNFGDLGASVVIGAGLVVVLAIVTGWCMSFALRIKLGKWWRNTVLFKLFKLFFKALKHIPSVWRVAVLFFAVAIIEAIVLVANAWEPDNLMIFWFVEKLVLFGVTVAVAVMAKKLIRGGEALASGDFSYRVDTQKMIGAVKKHGEALNRIGVGMNVAVEERLKSERMKTELITNVSHDIKTPLTSIINYSDLISKEKCDNENIKEYSVVLLRQSERLKRLIEDLIEVSKATSGNTELKIEPCNVGVMVLQAIGEYESRFSEKGLVIVSKEAENTSEILADGRKTWRILDNLMSNILKYALENTRVYISVEEYDNEIKIVFKNTSKESLEISAEELKERFIRGDSSRNSEGNGLGLAIADSLCEIQGGRLDLVIDGDLFKAVVSFPKAIKDSV